MILPLTFFLLWTLPESLSGVTPRSDSTLAMPRASTPQLGATLLSQRLCTFILQTEDRKMKGEGMRTYSVFQCMSVSMFETWKIQG